MLIKACYRYVLLVVCSLLVNVPGEAAERRNWHNDPFFPISKDFADCPMPAGPYVTAEQDLAEQHHRAERGTTCWLVGKCDRPTSYAYDADIAAAIKEALPQMASLLANTRLWVSVQGRVVYIEGCATLSSISRELEKFIVGLPYVEIAVAKIGGGEMEDPPYTVLAPEYQSIHENGDTL
jgi:hypothetical protein